MGFFDFLHKKKALQDVEITYDDNHHLTVTFKSDKNFDEVKVDEAIESKLAKAGIVVEENSKHGIREHDGSETHTFELAKKLTHGEMRKLEKHLRHIEPSEVDGVQNKLHENSTTTIKTVYHGLDAHKELDNIDLHVGNKDVSRAFEVLKGDANELGVYNKKLDKDIQDKNRGEIEKDNNKIKKDNFTIGSGIDLIESDIKLAGGIDKLFSADDIKKFDQIVKDLEVAVKDPELHAKVVQLETDLNFTKKKQGHGLGG